MPLVQRTLLVLLMSGLLLPGSGLSAATVVVSPNPSGPTPLNLAYNLGHFFPGSNASDWWRYSRVSGARIFMAPSHFNVSGIIRPGDADVVDEASFLARRAALRADPLNTDYINWPVIIGRFNETLSGNNVIRPQHALEEIHRLGGRILAQMNLTEGSFPISGESDWQGKWRAWRMYYALALYLAREFDVERYAQHNEPNHPDNAISVSAWLMRVRLCSDAVSSALADVNALYGKSLQPRYTAPVTAGSPAGSAYTEFGKPLVTSIRTDFLGNTHPDYKVFHLYAYQQYTATLSSFVNSFNSLRDLVVADTPSGTAPLDFALTEFNLHTAANYDTMTETPDTLSKAVRLGASFRRLAAAGMDELYLFKFGMTGYSGNFPVQKNGMLYCDNVYSPFRYGTMTRGGEAWRLFNKGFAPGRQLLAFSASGTGASDLEILVSRDPVTNFHYIYSVNDTGGGIPLEIDLTALGIPEGQHVIIEDVSQWRRGLLRSMERVQGGLLQPGSQPGQTVWLITIPGAPQRVTGGDEGLLTIPVSKDAMVRDGAHKDANFGGGTDAWARNDPATADQRAAVFLQFDLPPDWNPDDLQLAVLALPVAPVNGGAETIHAHLYGIDNHGWEEGALTWTNAPNLRKNGPVGNRIRHGSVQDAGATAHVLGQLTASGGYTLRRVDVTDYLARQQAGRASFLITQDPRWDVDIHVDSIPSSHGELTGGDTQPDGMRVRTREGATEAEPAATLILVRSQPQPTGYDAWIAAAFPDETDPEIIGPEANPAKDGLPNFLKFALGLDPTVPAGPEAPGLFPDETGQPAFYFTRNLLAEGVSLEVQGSFDLQEWSPLDTAVTLEDDGVRVLLKAPLDPQPASPRFVRIQVAEASNIAFEYIQDFDALGTGGGTWTDDATLPGWYADKTSFTATFGGASGTGALYNYGVNYLDLSYLEDRSLGGQPSTVTPVTIGLRLPNESDKPIQRVDVDYVVEQWRADTSPDSQVMLSYALFAPGTGSLDSGTWTPLLSFTPSLTSGIKADGTTGTGAIVGNLYQTEQSVSLTHIGWSAGLELWLRWSFVKTSGSNIHMAIDDLRVMGYYTP